MEQTFTRWITRAAGLAAIGLLAATAPASAAGTGKLTRAQASKLSISSNVTGIKRAPKKLATAAQAPNSACTATNGTDVQIVDLQTVESTMTVAGCTGNAAATSTAEIHIVHTYRGDLVVDLIAPDGSVYNLHNRAGGSADNLDQTYTVNLAGEATNGTWRLRVRDAAASDNGFINTWTLNLGTPPGPACVGTNPVDVAIPDLTTVESAITLAGCTGNAAADAKVEVHIVHTYRGDLVVSLIAPDGSVYILHNRAGGSADNLDQTYTVNLGSETRNGTWRLRVHDAATADNGYINTWTLSV